MARLTPSLSQGDRTRAWPLLARRVRHPALSLRRPRQRGRARRWRRWMGRIKATQQRRCPRESASARTRFHGLPSYRGNTGLSTSRHTWTTRGLARRKLTVGCAPRLPGGAAIPGPPHSPTSANSRDAKPPWRCFGSSATASPMAAPPMKVLSPGPCEAFTRPSSLSLVSRLPNANCCTPCRGAAGPGRMPTGSRLWCCG